MRLLIAAPPAAEYVKLMENVFNTLLGKGATSWNFLKGNFVLPLFLTGRVSDDHPLPPTLNSEV